jgi:hypothetical protein
MAKAQLLPLLGQVTAQRGGQDEVDATFGQRRRQGHDGELGPPRLAGIAHLHHGQPLRLPPPALHDSIPPPKPGPVRNGGCDGGCGASRGD